MDSHLEAVADRALIQTKSQKRRELRDVLDDYVPAGQRTAARRACPTASAERRAQASMPWRVSSRSALSFHTSICTILPPRTTKRST